MSNNIYFELLRKRASQKKTYFDTANVELEFIDAGLESSNDSGAISLFGTIVCGRMTVWESGNLESEILDSSSEEQLFLESLILNDAEELAVKWEEFLKLFMDYERG